MEFQARVESASSRPNPNPPGCRIAITNLSTRYSDVTLSRLAGDMFGCLPSHRPTFLSTKPQLLHPLLPVCCGAMEVPFDALYDIGMCTCTRLRSMTTITITFTTGAIEEWRKLASLTSTSPLITPNKTSETRIPWLHRQRNALSFPLKPHSYHAYTSPRPRPRPQFSFFWFFLVLSLPQIRGAGWGGACSAPGETR